jgi:hypothetical protein
MNADLVAVLWADFSQQAHDYAVLRAERDRALIAARIAREQLMCLRAMMRRAGVDALPDIPPARSRTGDEG